MSTIRNTYTTFTAREAERITGVSLDLQRDWRRRKFLRRHEGHFATYDAFDLAHLLTMRVMQDRGIGPKVSSQFASMAALRIVYFALCWNESIEDNTGGVIGRFLEKHKRPRGALFVGWTNKDGDPDRYLVTWANGEIEFLNDLKSAFGDVSWSERYAGAILILDLEALGGLIVDRAGRPLVAVDLVEPTDTDASE